MNAIRTSVVISFVMTCGCGVPKVTLPTATIQTNSTGQPGNAGSALANHTRSATTSVAEESPTKTEPRRQSKTIATDPETGALLVDFNELNVQSVLDISPSLSLPEWLKSLDGKLVRIQGHMYAPTQTTTFNRFLLVYCDPASKLATVSPYQSIDVTLVDGTMTTVPANDPLVEVVGRFRVHPEVEDGRLVSLFQLEDATLLATPR